MPSLQIEKLCERASRGFQELDANRRYIEDCYDYLVPYKNTFNNNGSNAGQSYYQSNKQYDSTATVAAKNFVDTMQSNFTPPFTRWVELKAGPGIKEEFREKLNKDLSSVTDIIFSYLNASNFATASAEMYWDWGVGTGVMWLHEGDQQNPLNFIAAPASQTALVEGRFGTVDSKFRKHKVKARLIKETWPLDKIELNEDLQEIIKTKPDEEVELLEACYYDYTDLVWRYEVVHEASKHMLLSRIETTEPCLTPRWMKVPGFTRGIGPFIMAMMDIKTLNKVKEYMLSSAALNIFGLYTVAKGNTFNPNTMTLRPGMMIPVERNGGPDGPSIAPLPRAGDYQMQEFLIRDLQDSIRKTMLDTRLPAETPQPKTAFEISQRIREFQTDIGAAYGRAMFEYVQPMFKRIIAILTKKGLLTLPEDFQLDNFLVQVQIVSPIAQSQAMEDVQKLVSAMQIVAQVNPSIVPLAYNIERLPAYLSEKTGAPASMLRDEEEQEAIKQAVVQMIAQQQQQAQGEQSAGV